MYLQPRADLRHPDLAWLDQQQHEPRDLRLLQPRLQKARDIRDYRFSSIDVFRAFVKILRVCCAWRFFDRCFKDVKRKTQNRFVSISYRGIYQKCYSCWLQERLSSSLSSQEKDFGFQNRPRIVANGVRGGQGNKAGQNGGQGVGHTIIVTPVTSPETKSSSNGVIQLQTSGPPAPVESGASRGALSIKQNIRYAVNYRWVRGKLSRMEILWTFYLDE